MKLLIVESPNKTKTIAGFLGAGWSVKASVGHITELASDGDDNLGFDITKSGVSCRYVPRGDRGAKVIKDLRALAQKAEIVYLATDPDREGESISWHLKEQLGLEDGRYRRITYTQITEAAVKTAIDQSRDLDMDLIRAQFARQTLDKLVGFKASRLVQRASAGQARSAGRVQSAALHIVCQREREIQGFKPVPYWSVQAEYK
ncbi:MAG: DNA topoisomerase I, partial [Gammaproteobacteria bacterium]